MVWEGSAEQQYLKMSSHAGTHTRVLETFEEIQNSSNPLSQSEIDALLKKRPQRYLSLKTVK